jgi:preprotein translocase subunit SecB
VPTHDVPIRALDQPPISVSDGGLPPPAIEPIDFAQLYAQLAARASAEQDQQLRQA